MAVFSFAFFGFFAAVFALRWTLGERGKISVLFFASIGFYALYGWGYTLLLAACLLLCWAGGLWLGQGGGKPRLALCVLLALAPLAFFKYLDPALGVVGLSGFSLVQPVGISYYTFQMVSYLVDIYRKKLRPQRSFLRCAVSLSLFLQITSGPLTHPRELLRQLDGTQQFDSAKATAWVQLILLGLFKKVVVADTLATYTQAAYAQPQGMYGLSLLVSAVFYSVEIYADFSGYTDLVRGMGGLLGLELAENFTTPYFSRSVREFWRRWHISLSGWLAEYVYIPLGGSRVGRVRRCFNLLVTFLLSGLWHGASLTMLVWGGLHGAYQVIGLLTRPLRSKITGALRLREDGLLLKAWQTFFTFCLVTFAWIFFGAPDFAGAWYIVTHLFADFALSVSYFKESLVLLGLSAFSCVRIAALLIALFGIDVVCFRWGWREWISGKKPWVQAVICWLLLFSLILMGNIGGGNSMYFQF